MTLHIFNPEHDIALASGLDNFTAPHAGRQLRHDLGWLPALWAQKDDYILVDDADFAYRKASKHKPLSSCGRVTYECRQFLTWKPSESLRNIDRIEVWGWDSAIKSHLQRIGISEQLLPSHQQLEEIRLLSHRRTSARLLRSLCGTLKDLRLVGEAQECTSTEEIDAGIERWKTIVLKAPWSSSGRGIRFINEKKSASVEGWIRNLLSHQGSIMMEPYYNKVKDFGMEFMADGNGNISYLGLSLFHTANGAYQGNLLATEQRKRTEMSNYIPSETLDTVERTICQQLGSIIGNRHEGPFGIDMMVVGSDNADEGFLLHPCVEINLRRTMGHAALALTRLVNPNNDDDVMRVMRIVYEDNQYKLKIEKL